MSLKSKRLGFTLAEMLVVVVILVTLMVTGKFYYDLLTVNSRDSKRITDLKTIEIALSTFKSYKKVYPKPSKYAKIESSGVVLSYQGEFGHNLRKIVKMTRTPWDPLDKSFYTYATNRKKSEYQLLSFFENEAPTLEFSDTANADNFLLEERKPHTVGFPVGIILNTDNTPVNRESKVLDLTSDTANTYKIVYKDHLIGEGKGGNFTFSKNEFRNCNDIKIAGAGSQNGLYAIVPEGENAVKVYCDMQTAGGGWTLVLRVYSDRDYLTTNKVGELSSPSQKSTAKLSDELINKIATQNRFLVKVGNKEENKFFLRNKYFEVSDTQEKTHYWISALNQPEMQFSCIKSQNTWHGTSYNGLNKNYIWGSYCNFSPPTDTMGNISSYKNTDNSLSIYMYSDARDERSCGLNHCKTAGSQSVVPGSIWVK